MKGFFDAFKGDDDKKKKSGNNKKKNNNNNNNNNPFGNFGKKQSFGGTGQSLGGSLPGKVIAIELCNPGPLGVRVERRPTGVGAAIVNEVVAGSQADDAGLQHGDIVCFAGTNGQDEMMYEMFLELAKSDQRPLVFDIRRIPTKSNNNNDNNNNASADAYNRKQAMIAAAEAREKASKAKAKPISKGGNNKNTTRNNNQFTEQEKQLHKERLAAMEAQQPMSLEAIEAMKAAKADEAALAAQLGYNPYEIAKTTAGQARNATTTVNHGAIQHSGSSVSTSSSNPSRTATTEPSSSSSIPAVAPPADPATAASNNNNNNNNNTATMIEPSLEYQDVYSTVVSTNDHAVVVTSFGIARKLLLNATTKGQNTDNEETAAKFRRVRLSNAKIKAAIVDVQGAVELMIAAGFNLVEEDGESYLVYPALYNGPDWLSTALKQMEQYEKS